MIGETFDATSKRIQAAIDVKEPDRVPINALLQGFQPNDAGHTMAKAVYDFGIAKESVTRFAQHYKPDAIVFDDCNYYGMGKALEILQPTRLEWAGKPGGMNDDHYVQQIHEITTLPDEEMELFDDDYTGWLLHYGLPRASKVFEPLANLYTIADGPNYDPTFLAAEMSTPEFRQMMETIWKANDICADVWQKTALMEEELNNSGVMTPLKACSWVPLDCYGAYLRSTGECLMDLYENEETVLKYCDRNLEAQLASIQAQGQMYPGKWCAFYLTKASDQFMGTEHFRKYYWKYLQKMIEATVDAGLVPYVYTEGHFNSRLEFLKDVPKGVIYHFESTVDMALAKKLLGQDCCIAGGFPIADLLFGKKETVIDKAKRLLDTCMPGGGYIFETEAGFDEAKRENVEALFETVHEYGKY